MLYMSENASVWPPSRLNNHRNSQTNVPILIVSPTHATPSETTVLTPHNLTPNTRAPLADTANKKRRVYRNGYDIKPPTPSTKPYALNNRGYKRQVAFSFGNTPKIRPLDALSPAEWDRLAMEANLLPEGGKLRNFQVQSANIITTRSNDLCVIAPTGQGKSLLWTLPLLAQPHGVSLVITPYTSLGCEGEER